MRKKKIQGVINNWPVLADEVIKDGANDDDKLGIFVI